MLHMAIRTSPTERNHDLSSKTTTELMGHTPCRQAGYARTIFFERSEAESRSSNSMIVESSKDILNLVIALSLFLVAFAISWFIFEVAVIVRRMRKLVDGLQERLEKIDDAIHSIKDKLGSTPPP